MGSANINVLTGNLTFKSLTPCNLADCTKDEIRTYFENSYDLNESLFVSLKDQNGFYKCPDRLRLPLIFYYGHTAAVYVNKFILAGLLQPSDRINLSFETLLETGVDEMSWDDTENYRMGGKFVWPALDEVVEYRRRVKELILRVIDKTPLELPVTFDSPWWAVFMGMEHERIHLETSSVLIRQLPIEMVTKPTDWKYAPVTAGEPVLDNRMIRVPELTVELGKPLDFPSYGWDNEYGRVNCRVPEFEASEFLVTNREFLAFIESEGYDNEKLWTEEGWRWRQYRSAKHPSFWTCGGECKSACGADLATYSHCKAATHLINGINAHCNGHIKTDDNGHQGNDEGGGLQMAVADSYRLRVMFDEIPMPWDWPVVINYHEAKAFCAWKGPDYRLPSEAEHNVIRGTQRPLSDGWKCDIIHQAEIPDNLNMKYGSSTPVNLHPANDLGFYDAYGNVWEWAEDHFNGLPGTTTSAFYDDFSTPCYDGRHNLILGGSWISTGDEASRFARYAFRRHFLQHAGFRVVRTVTSETVKVPIRLVEDEVYVQGVGTEKNPLTLPEKVQYEPVSTTNIQYQQDTEEMLSAQLHNDWELEMPPSLVYARLAVAAADKHSAGSGGRTLYVGCGTGRGTAPLSTRFDDLLAVDFSGRFIDMCLKLQAGQVVPLPSGKALSVPVDKLSKVTFKQLTWLPNEIGFFDFALVTSFDRVLNHKAWLKRMKEVLNPGGLLVVMSQHYGAHAIQPELDSKFELLDMQDFPVAHGVMNIVKMTVWRHN